MKLNFYSKDRLFMAGFHIVKILQNRGFKAFWVGGIVRSLLLKKKSDNIDIATNATPDEVEKILKQNKIHTKSVGKRFGTILTTVDNFPIEITTFRAEGRYSDKRHPDKVEFIDDFTKDAKRRDFTINAFYFDPISKNFFDPVNGMKDLKGKILRFVGDPKKRIDEDALRMLRAVRFSTQLGFSGGAGPRSAWKLEKNTFAAIKTRVKYIQDVSGERIKAELDKILLSGSPAQGIILLDKIGLIKFILPELEAIKTFSHQSKVYHLEGTIFDHEMIALDKAKKEDLRLLYALLFHDIGKPQKAERVLKAEGWVISTKGHENTGADIFLNFAKRFKFSNSQKATIEWVIRNHMLQNKFSTLDSESQFKIASHPDFDLLIKHWGYDELAKKRLEFNDDNHKRYLRSVEAAKKIQKALKINKSKLENLANGNLIMKHSKLKPGKELGKKIEEVKVQIVLGKISNENELREFLK